jgi:hypothetical protein
MTPADFSDIADGYIWREKHETEKTKLILDVINNRLDYWGSYMCAIMSVGLHLKKKAKQGDFMPRPVDQEPEQQRIPWQELKARIMGNVSAHNETIKGR